MKNLIIVIVLLAVCGYVYSTYGEPILAQIQASQQAGVPDTTTPAPDTAEPETPAPVWTFEQKGEVDGIPQTEVTLSYKGTTHVLGTHQGNCFLIEESNWQLLPDEETGVMCYWAGGGTELGIFNREGVKTVEQGVIDEGSAESPSVRGEFTVIKAL
jgi:hypothetical protein